MDPGVLTVLEYCFLALIYLFLFRVVRTVYGPPRIRLHACTPAQIASAAPVGAVGGLPPGNIQGGRLS